MQRNNLPEETFSVTGTVMHGKRLGRTLGFPTANLPRPNGAQLPPDGVHAALLTVLTGPLTGRSFPCVLNQGSQPTAPSGIATVEAYIPGFSGNLYDQQVRVEYRYFLRPERKFDSLDALKAQMERDTATALACLSQSPRR